MFQKRLWGAFLQPREFVGSSAIPPEYDWRAEGHLIWRRASVFDERENDRLTLPRYAAIFHRPSDVQPRDGFGVVRFARITCLLKHTRDGDGDRDKDQAESGQPEKPISHSWLDFRSCGISRLKNSADVRMGRMVAQIAWRPLREDALVCLSNMCSGSDTARNAGQSA
jgi:hypothetical protein